MEITLGESTKLLDNIMVNYSQWHTERSTSKKVHAIEEINVFSGKMDGLMNFKQLDHEHVAQAWERMKLMIRNCPTHGLNLWMIIQNFYAGLNFASRNLLDSAAGGTFMEITLGEATKLLDNIMVNSSQWHTERSTNKKVHAIEEINVLSGKMDELMKLFATKSVSSDPNDMPLSTLIENNN